jgi:uncharacterized membrane protein YeiH
VTSQPPPPPKDRVRYWLNLTLAGFAAQAGCFTLIIVLTAVFGGLWLDATLGTKPVLTMVLLIVSIPVSIIVMFFLVRTATKRIKANPANDAIGTEESHIGKN